jgi:Fe(3+) dicitrate transport protein
VGVPLRRTAGSAHVLGNRELERFEYDDPHAVLSHVPGVYTRGEDGFGLRPNIGIRGVNPDRSKKVTLLEDGVLLGPAPYTAPAAYYFPLMTRMSQLRAIKGPGAVAYGPNTVGGAIDLTTRPIPTGVKAGVDVALGQFGYTKGDGYFGYGDDRAGFLFQGTHLGSTGFKQLPSGADTGFSRNELMWKGQFTLDPYAATRHQFRLKLTYSSEASNETYLGLTEADFRENPLQRYAASALDRMRNHRISLVATHDAELAGGTSIVTDVYHHGFQRVWRKVNAFRGASLFDVLSGSDSGRNQVFQSLLRGESSSSTPQESLLIGPNDRDFTSQGVESRVLLEAITGPLSHRAQIGARFHYDHIDRRHSEDAFLLIEGELFPEGSATTVTTLNEAGSFALSGYAVDAISLGNLTVTPGMRFEAIHSYAKDKIADSESKRWAFAPVPGVGLFYALTPEWGVLAGAYRGFSAPAAGSPDDVRPEFSVNYEVGTRYASSWLRADAIAYYNSYSNLTDVCTFSSGCTNDDLDRQFDAGRARIYGVEASANADIPIQGALHAPFLLAYTYTRAQFLSNFTSDDPIYGEVQTLDELPYVPTHELSVAPGLEHPLAGGAVHLRYLSAMREVAGRGPLSETLATDEQFILDLSAYVQPLSFLRVYATAQNLLDAHTLVSRRPFGARPNAPRIVSVGAKAWF